MIDRQGARKKHEMFSVFWFFGVFRGWGGRSDGMG